MSKTTEIPPAPMNGTWAKVGDILTKDHWVVRDGVCSPFIPARFGPGITVLHSLPKDNSVGYFIPGKILT